MARKFDKILVLGDSLRAHRLPWPGPTALGVAVDPPRDAQDYMDINQ